MNKSGSPEAFYWKPSGKMNSQEAYGQTVLKSREHIQRQCNCKICIRVSSTSEETC